MIFYWSIIALQDFVVFYQTSTWISHIYTYIPSLLKHPPISLPISTPRLIQRPCFSFLSHTAKSCWLSILHMIIWNRFPCFQKFPCCSFHTSHPLLPSPHVHKSILCVCFSIQFSSVQFSCSVVSDSLQPHESQHARPPVHHQLPEFTQTHVHRVSDAIQPSHPLSYPSPPAPNPSQDQGLCHWVNSSHEVAKVLEFQL